MIISSLANKDTYVTNLNLGLTDATFSNVGKASTLDLFKISKENKNIKARSIFTITNVQNDLINQKTFTLKDSNNNSVKFEIDSGSQHDDGRVNGSGNVIIGIDSTSAGVNQLQKTINAINNVNVMDQTVNGGSNQLSSTLTLNITAYKLDSKRILLEQDSKGDSGETSVLFDASANFTITDFVRIQSSSVLLNFDLSDFKNKYIQSGQIANSVFNNKSNYKAYIKLFDVGTASTRPKDFNLKMSVLSNSFDEGIGSDIYNFSDIGKPNFSKISDSVSWSIEKIIAEADCVTGHYKSIATVNNFDKGNEDCVFDITDYLHDYLNSNQTSTSFAVCFDFSNMFDEYTYFLKRLGSVQINNKIKKPRLEVHIDETKIQHVIGKNSKRFLDTEEIFYLYNKTNTLNDFEQNKTYKLKLEYLNSSNQNVIQNNVITSSDVYDFRGQKKVGIKKFVISNSLISQFNTDIEQALATASKISVKMTYYYEYTDDNNTLQTVNIAVENVDFNQIAYLTKIDRKKIHTVVKSQNSDFEANNQIIYLTVDFIDVVKEYTSVNTPIDIESENLGNVHYSIYDIDTDEEIISKNEAENDATRLIFNGKNYTLNFFASEIYKNRRINFKFYYNDETSILQDIVYDKNFNLRF